MVVPEYAVREIEEQADALLRKAYRSVYPYTVPVTAVDVEWVAEQALGISFHPVPGLRSRFGVDGLLGRDRKGRPIIVVDKELFDHPNQHRYRFTFAEEIGHSVLHLPHLPKVNDRESVAMLYQAIENWEVAERNAKRFAAALLMPMESVERQVAGIYAGLREGPTPCGGDELIQRIVCILVKMFRVSPETMQYRLSEYPARLMDRIRIAETECLRTLPPRSE